MNFQFINAGLRECYEETGLQLTPQHFLSEDIKVLALWEVCRHPSLFLTFCETKTIEVTYTFSLYHFSQFIQRS